jgi:hypothetical protein
MDRERPLQIIALWSSFLLGTLFHTLVGLMPLFHGRQVIVEEALTDTQLGQVFWGMQIFFLLPMLAIVAASFHPGRTFRRGHYWMTLLYSLMNLAHLIADIVVRQPVPSLYWLQVFLMAVLFGLGLGLNRVSWLWLHERSATAQ